ncbi:MAG: hypothetical protein KIS81_00790 [Maricaulaceae bacterium]|nr:hypothetical protein [Maricaulaceae bacterium]
MSGRRETPWLTAVSVAMAALMALAMAGVAASQQRPPLMMTITAEADR